METFLAGESIVVHLLRIALLSIALVFAAICVLDWAVRTRKISPFNAIARFCRSTVDPIIAPIERSVVRAGGTPAAAPLWALAVIVIGGILLLTLLDAITLEVVKTIVASSQGAAGDLPFAGELDLHDSQDGDHCKGHQLVAADLSLLEMGAVELPVERAVARTSSALRPSSRRTRHNSDSRVHPAQHHRIIPVHADVSGRTNRLSCFREH